MAMRRDILVLGATGYTGFLIAKYLATHSRRSQYKLGLAGRAQQKLKHLASYDFFSGVELHLLDLVDDTALNLLVSSYRVVINAVGDYYCNGTRIVGACVRNSVDYLDMTGEVPWVIDIIARFDGTRGPNESVIIPFCGFQAIPSDICAFESCKALSEQLGPGTAGKSQTSHQLNAFTSRGTILSALSLLEDVPRERLWGSIDPFSLSPIRGNLLSGPRLHYSMSPYCHMQGSFFLLGFTNTSVVNRSWALSERSSRSNMRYGDHFAYEEFLATPFWAVSVLVSGLSFVFAYAVLYVPLFRALIKYIAQRETFNPDYKSLPEGSLKAINITLPASSTSKIWAKTTFETRNCDVGYLGTSVMISECALILALHPRRELPLSDHPSRVLTPSTAFGSRLTANLNESGFFVVETSIASGKSE